MYKTCKIGQCDKVDFDCDLRTFPSSNMVQRLVNSHVKSARTLYFGGVF